MVVVIFFFGYGKNNFAIICWKQIDNSGSHQKGGKKNKKEINLNVQLFFF